VSNAGAEEAAFGTKGLNLGHEGVMESALHRWFAPVALRSEAHIDRQASQERRLRTGWFAAP
jgi:hypothetical protein